MSSIATNEMYMDALQAYCKAKGGVITARELGMEFAYGQLDLDYLDKILLFLDRHGIRLIETEREDLSGDLT